MKIATGFENGSAAPIDVAAGSATRTLTIQTATGTSAVKLTNGRIALMAGAAAIVLGWTAFTSTSYVISKMGTRDASAELALVEAAYQQRIDQLILDRDNGLAQAADATRRLDTALGRIVEQQVQLQAMLRDQAELSASLDAMHGHISAMVTDRDAAETRAAELTGRLATLQSDIGDSPDQTRDLQVVLGAVSDALELAVRDRDTQAGDIGRMESEIATLELKMQVTADRQERLVAGLEDAIEVSFKPLEDMFERSGMSVDNLLSSVRQSYTGIGGPETALNAGSISGFADPTLNDRFASLMGDMDRMNMLRIAAAKLPYAMPVQHAHRFTSGFGYRRDPKNGVTRAHNGIDLAGPRGTPIESTADGVVVFAGRQSGFGNLIRIRHDFGFETLYAHLNKIHVKVGDRIARGEHIGDMGTTGRSTGVHLHYEVHLGGKPVNPLTYIKAAQDVF